MQKTSQVKIKFKQNTDIVVFALNTFYIVTIWMIFCVKNKKVVEIAKRLYMTKEFLIISNTQGILKNKVVSQNINSTLWSIFNKHSFELFNTIQCVSAVYYCANVVKIFIRAYKLQFT